MRLTLRNNDSKVFVLEIGYAEREFAKKNGFKWNPESKKWETPHVVAINRTIKAYRAAHEGEVIPMTPEAVELFKAENERVAKLPKCGRCAGTGQFITGMLNGRPTGPGGICYRCEGKGYQHGRDEERNDNYDQGAFLRACREMMA